MSEYCKYGKQPKVIFEGDMKITAVDSLLNLRSQLSSSRKVNTPTPEIIITPSNDSAANFVTNLL